MHQLWCLLHRVAVRGSAHPLGLGWIDLLQVWGMLSSSPASPGGLHCFFIRYLTVWGVEPVVTHQTSRLVSTGVCGVQEKQAGGSSV